eukprot:3743906-Amphidinium_carterae.1
MKSSADKDSLVPSLLNRSRKEQHSFLEAIPQSLHVKRKGPNPPKRKRCNVWRLTPTPAASAPKESEYLNPRCVRHSCPCPGFCSVFGHLVLFGFKLRHLVLHASLNIWFCCNHVDVDLMLHC